MPLFWLGTVERNILSPKSISSRLKLVYVGNFCGDRWLLELLENVSKMPDKVEIHIGGVGGLANQINAYAEKYENIFSYGKMKYQDVLKLESECDCLAALYETHIPNHVYAAPNKFYEALALGKPLLMIEGSGMSEIVEREKLGVVMKPTVESFESALSEIQELIWTDKTLKERMKKLFDEQYRPALSSTRLSMLFTESGEMGPPVGEGKMNFSFLLLIFAFCCLSTSTAWEEIEIVR